MNPSKPKISKEDAMAALADLFAEKVTKKANAPKAAKKAPIPLDERPLAVRFAVMKTGSISWKAVARVVQIERQVCTCCDTETRAVKDEFFLLENGVTKARWLRHEAYGIINPDKLAIQVEELPEVRQVSACAACTAFDLEFALISRKQMELPL